MPTRTRPNRSAGRSPRPVLEAHVPGRSGPPEEEPLAHVAASRLHLDLLAPDTVDAYVRRSDLGTLVSDHGLQPPSAAAQPTVTLRAVPDDAWLLTEREIAPIAAVAIDLSFYTDSRSARAGHDLLVKLGGKRGGARPA